MAPLSVPEALARILDGVSILGFEDVDLVAARGRLLARSLSARHSQPPFDASAMDGYAVRGADVQTLPARLEVVGEAAAGHPYPGALDEGQAVRIFTGAPVPDGADAIVIQENTQRDGSFVIVREGTPDPGHIRKRGSDFSDGATLLPAGVRLEPRYLALAASMGHGRLPVVRKPVIAILATGDELVEPGGSLGPGQIICSNPYGVAAMVEGAGAEARIIGIARDTAESLTKRLAAAEGADILVTIGGASVGDHDLVARVLQANGMTLDFWKIAMRPGKPLMFGRRGATRFLGLPGNPVASLVCSHLFLKPLLSRLGGRPFRQDVRTAVLGRPMPANDLRQDYVRAVLRDEDDGSLTAFPFETQDSSMLKTFAESNGLVIREPFAPAAEAGEPCTVLRLR